jgi:hypothetical protein
VLNAVRGRVVRKCGRHRVRKHAIGRVDRAGRRLLPPRGQRRGLGKCVRVRVDLQAKATAARLARIARAWHVAVTGVRWRRRAARVARGAEALVAVLHTREGEAAVAAEGDARRWRVGVRELVVLGRREDARGCVDRAAVCSGPAGREGGRRSRGRRRGRAR